MQKVYEKQGARGCGGALASPAAELNSYNVQQKVYEKQGVRGWGEQQRHLRGNLLDTKIENQIQTVCSRKGMKSRGQGGGGERGEIFLTPR